VRFYEGFGLRKLSHLLFVPHSSREHDLKTQWNDMRTSSGIGPRDQNSGSDNADRLKRCSHAGTSGRSILQGVAGD
jgi:hypothetical protein